MQIEKKKIRGKLFGLLFLIIVLFCVGCGTVEETAKKPEQQREEQQDVSNMEMAELEATEDSEVVETNETIEVAPRLEFPIEIEDGKLTVESVFQYTGINVDAKDEVCEDIGAIQLKNSSNKYLESADVEVKLSGGDNLCFYVEDIPVGKSVIAFEVSNARYDVSKSVEKMTVKPVWTSDVSTKEEWLNYEVDGLVVTVKNISNNAVKDLTVKYHCSYEGIYFGGKSYEKTIDALGAGESIKLEASECYFGEAAVVNVLD